MMIDDKNPHREIFPWGSVTYWEGHNSAGKNDAWTSCEVLGSSYAGLRIPRERIRDLTKVMQLLDEALARGKIARSRELCLLLGAAEVERR